MAQISDTQQGAAMEVEEASGVHGISPLPMGTGREVGFNDARAKSNMAPARVAVGSQVMERLWTTASASTPAAVAVECLYLCDMFLYTPEGAAVPSVAADGAAIL
ncbi:hypothetical protein THAOC_29284 [Thalassiosira oceanica]|uniref:Uncharacterized protein n=1 Tax=Thalassiosira oceanica TaxID=159749 RepID=K0RGW2_THAOC|nr:hypothetical protein THAOC_29284 [Thalassiosira oceanica]|eukprot:EJK51539.1 hypothetical protein THAOC_29284 [Thalassiosira oceanica]